MSLREDITAAVKASMLARQPERTSALRMIQAKLKDTDIAARPKGVEQVPDEEIFAHAALDDQIPPRFRGAVPPGRARGTGRQGGGTRSP